jgi:hypothetical protein
LLQKSERASPLGIIAWHLGIDPTEPLMEYNNGVYNIDAQGVRRGYMKYTEMALDGLQAPHPFALTDVFWFYFHQANGRLINALAT